MIARIALIAFALTALWTTTASANSYWVSLGDANGQPTITPGVDGFSLHATGGPWNTWSNNCTANPGTYIAGAFCKLRFNVPGGLTAGAVAGGGQARGQYRTASDLFVLRTERPGGNPSYVNDVSADGAFAPGWGALGSYVDIGLYVTTKATTTSQSNWFHLDSFTVLLTDASVPAIQYVSPAGGAWKGLGCTPISYAWSDAGSQMWSVSLTNLSTGAGVDSWTAAPGRTVVQSGIPTAARTPCLTAQPTGTYTYRTTGVDRSGNSASYDFNVSFDTTAPVISAPTLNGAAIEDGTTIRTYRPAIEWTVADAHSGIATIAASIDGAPINHAIDGSTVRLAPAADLPLGDHTLTLMTTDNAGNTTQVSRRVNIIDAVAPVITIAHPSASGSNSPLLDATATDDRTGIAGSSWSVTVNGAPLRIESTGPRLQAEIGYLISGIHTIVVRVADNAGNVSSTTLTYLARSDDATTIPQLTGIQVLAAPDEITESVTVRIRAAAVQNGRPLAGMRAELRQGSSTVAGKPVSSDGTVDIALALTSGTPLTLTVNGSGLPEQDIKFRFVPKPASDNAGISAPGATANAIPKLKVKRVIDGDSIELTDGRIINLLQIDAPEADECFGGRSTRALRSLVKPGTTIHITTDATAGFAAGTARYVWTGKTLLNRTLVQRGFAAPHMPKNRRGRYAAQLLAEAKAARAKKRGFWSGCPSTKLTPTFGAVTGPT